MNEPVTYTRLPGRGLGLAARASLWLAGDHVLLVHETLSGEVYRRFFLRDIEAVMIRDTRTQARWSLVLLVLTVLSLLPLLGLFSDDRAEISAAWLALISLVWIGLLVANIVLGPTCETRIRTVVQDDVIPPLRRRRVALRVLAQLRPLIVAAQTTEIAGEHTR